LLRTLHADDAVSQTIAFDLQAAFSQGLLLPTSGSGTTRHDRFGRCSKPGARERNDDEGGASLDLLLARTGKLRPSDDVGVVPPRIANQGAQRGHARADRPYSGGLAGFGLVGRKNEQLDHG
jgi:hypothetical protein